MAIRSVCKDLYGLETEVELTRPDEQFGDFTTNVALQLAKHLNQSPRQIAEQISEGVRSQNLSIQNIEVAGPGFINIKLTDVALWELAEAEPPKTLTGKVILAEYSDPNPLKPLHAGHLYTTLVGDCIANLLEYTGAQVTRLNYGGDVGLHVGKSMWAIIKALGGEFPDKLQEVPPHDRSMWLGERYTEGNSAYEENEQAKKEIVETNKRVYVLHAGQDKDSPFAQIYWEVRQWSYDYFAVFYDQLGVHPFDRFIPESEVAELGLNIVREQLQNGVYEESDGAVVFNGELHGLHTRVFINSAGLPTYEAKDVGLLIRKWEDYKFDESFVITASEQAQYFEVMLKSVEQFNPEPVHRSRHLTHGTVKLKGGRKMSSRKGNVVLALDILQAVREAARKSDVGHSEDSILAAVKYAFAKNRIGGDIIYDPEESVSLVGNSGPYLQYAHARARSILAKAQENQTQNSEIKELDNYERSLLRKIGEYSDVVKRATGELMPHHICTYLYELAQNFNGFYEHNRVVGDDRQDLRLKLVQAYADNLKKGLTLLNITAPERM